MASNPSLVSRLISQLVRWLRIAGNSPEPSPLGTKEASTFEATLWKIESDEPGVTEPGVVVAYWVVHTSASRDLAIALINLSKLREDLRGKRNRNSTDPVRLTSRATFRAELNRYIEQDTTLAREQLTHIFVVAWQSRVPDANRFYKVNPVVAIPCDLVGASVGWGAGDRYSKAITRAIAHQLLRLKVRQDESWEFFVSQIDWLGWLEDYARHQFGPNHTLQPRRASPQ